MPMPGPSSPTVVIDARPRGPRGPMAGERVLGRPVLAHLVELAREVGPGPVAVHARLDEHEGFLSLLADPSSVALATGPPPEDAAILRTDRLYDARRLRRAVKRGRDPETAVAWRLDRPSGLASADAELVRRRTYQPIGRFWALGPARALARTLVPTRIRPNAVTLAAGSLMIGASAAVAFGPLTIGCRLATAAMLALALVLDTADGHLARLQGTASSFGRLLDAVLDEAADFALHIAVAWAMFARGGGPGWLLAALLYVSSKYLFVIAQATASDPSEASRAKPSGAVRASPLAAVVRLAGHADVRWHLWIVLAAIGRLDLALIAYSAYFPARTLALMARRGLRHD